MKKYVKPIMESEVFVANEYIGACWILSCTCTSTKEVISGDNINAAMFNEYNDKATVYQDGSNYIITGTILGKSGHETDTHKDITQVVGGYGCDRFWEDGHYVGGGWRYDLCRLQELLFDNSPQTITTAHHHAKLEPTNKENYPLHPNHS